MCEAEVCRFFFFFFEGWEQILTEGRGSFSQSKYSSRESLIRISLRVQLDDSPLQNTVGAKECGTSRVCLKKKKKNEVGVWGDHCSEFWAVA